MTIASPTSGTAPRGRIAREVAVYVAGLAGGVLIAWIVLRSGPSVRGAAGGGGGPAAGDGLAWRFLCAVALMATVTLAGGRLARLAGQPRVVGEIVGGILLGPSVFGALAPDAWAALFTPQVIAVVEQLAALGLVLFMLLIGFELDLGHLRQRGRLALIVCHASIVAPFSLGLLVALLLYPRLGAGGAAFVPFALFVGLAMSVTAFPVLAAILTERGMRGSPIGVVALACAAIDDVTAWCLLAAVVAIADQRDALAAVGTFAMLAAFVAVMFTLVRPVLTAAADALARRRDLAVGMLKMLFIAVLLSALATERMGLHLVFGAVLFGAVLPRRRIVEEHVERLQNVSALLLPLFFAASGMRTDLGVLRDATGLLPLAMLVIAAAIAGKCGAASLAACAMGLRWGDAATLGILMNCRGLTELVVLNVGLDLGIVSGEAFSILVLMALVTTAMTAPLLTLAGHPRTTGAAGAATPRRRDPAQK